MYFDSSRILDSRCPRTPYKPTSETLSLDSISVKGLHFGQRKLLLSEIEFLTAIFDKRKCDIIESDHKQRPVLVVYAGAANGSHLPILFRLFAEARFILIDPAPFCEEVEVIAEDVQGPIIELINDYCTDELCLRLSRMYGTQYDLYLISDIRTGVPKKMQKNIEHTEMMIRDNAAQRSWCWSLKAVAAMLKFHPPYPPSTDSSGQKCEDDDNTPDEIEYLDGIQLFGVWAPKSSSEVRLVVQGPFCHGYNAKMRKYNCKEHEEQCYHYNTSNRYLKDCAAERIIVDRYLKCIPNEYKNDITIVSNQISKDLKFPLFCPLENDFTEDHARWVYLLYSSRRHDIMHLYEPFKDVMRFDTVKDLIKRYGQSEKVPEDAQVSGKPLSIDFWKAFCRCDFESAYSLPRIQWKFYPLLDPKRPHRRENKGAESSRNRTQFARKES
ncbi:unnamed protein product [Phytomonas sp. EM1]|nr:unnamed protein product [Phytomonas sp. EM1]|eukprot:CCW62464.1 unnamed protein product [Phytomonas sp. isolate EM1]